MAELKTKASPASVEAFLNTIPDEQKRADCFTIMELMKNITGDKPKMWGSAIIGYCDVHLKYASGRQLDWFRIGFSPRKQNITLYIGATAESNAALLEKLGKHKTGKGCLYINKLADVDLKVLKQLIEAGLKQPLPTGYA